MNPKQLLIVFISFQFFGTVLAASTDDVQTSHHWLMLK